MAPPWVRTGARTIEVCDIDDLRPGEWEAVARAVPARQAEFASGRALLRELIGTDVEILAGPDRRPRFPDGVTGTLAHDHEVVVAATADGSRCRALGIDIEPLSVLTPDEARLVRRADERHLDPHLLFVLKEAAYKAWSSVGGRMLEHHQVVVDVDQPARTFTAIVDSTGVEFRGRYIVVENRHLALVVDDTTPV